MLIADLIGITAFENPIQKEHTDDEIDISPKRFLKISQTLDYSLGSLFEALKFALSEWLLHEKF